MISLGAVHGPPRHLHRNSDRRLEHHSRVRSPSLARSYDRAGRFTKELELLSIIPGPLPPCARCAIARRTQDYHGTRSPMPSGLKLCVQRKGKSIVGTGRKIFMAYTSVWKLWSSVHITKLHEAAINGAWLYPHPHKTNMRSLCFHLSPASPCCPRARA